MRKIKVGIIGCGAIGSTLAKTVVHDFKEKAKLCFICEKHKEKVKALEKKTGISVPIVSLEKLISGSDFILEAASTVVAAKAAKLALKQNKRILIMSVGGILGLNLTKELKKTKGKIWCPSGALAGVDGLLAAKIGKLKYVRLVTKKPPKALMGAEYFKKNKFPTLKDPKKPYLVFRGTAIKAVRAFPKNINVAAILSLAGIGADKTQVEIWTSKAFRSNQHEILIEGDFGKIHSVTENNPSSENPKTSYLAILSAVATLKEIFSPLRIGT